jgi:hypothetical protein
MVTFELVPALAAGLVGTAVMTFLMTVGRSMGMTSMDIALLVGSMATDDEHSARRLGSAVHWMMGTIVFGVVYAVVFVLLDSAAAVTGSLIGVVHALILGALVMPMMASVHPRMQGEADELHLASPGFFGVGFGRGTPFGLVLGHAVYGLVVALVYSTLL